MIITDVVGCCGCISIYVIGMHGDAVGGGGVGGTVGVYADVVWCDACIGVVVDSDGVVGVSSVVGVAVCVSLSVIVSVCVCCLCLCYWCVH